MPKAASSLHEKHPSRPLLAKIDSTSNMAIGRRYNVLSYPSLLLFAKGVDGDVWDIPAAPNVMPVLETVMLRYATQPAELNAKRKVWADKAARMASLMMMDGMVVSQTTAIINLISAKAGTDGRGDARAELGDLSTQVPVEGRPR